MLLLLLLAFGLLGIASRYIVSARPQVILLLSAGSIALLSPSGLLVVSFLVLINYPLICNSQKRSVRTITLIFNLFFLAAFHLYSFFGKEFTEANWPAVLGVSFIVLQLIDHSFKVHYKQVPPPTDLVLYLSAALYLPKFFSGPIASLPDVANQVRNPKTQRTTYGLNRIVLGLFKKLVLAESISPMVHSVLDFSDPYPALTIVAACCLYSLQLYFDFSGYSDIAVGVSAIWGIELPENFNFPFRQKSWSDFWKSWHSSLTGWLWQYIFNPLYLFFSRNNWNKKISALVCALLVFAGMAFFNGIQKGFYLSAGIFALLYLLEVLFSIKPFPLRNLSIFFFFSLGLLFFRLPGNGEYTRKLYNIACPPHIPNDWLRDFFAPLASGGSQQDHFNITVTLVLALTFLLFERKIFALFSSEKINYAAWFVLGILLFSWGVFESGERFIYMQF